MKPQPAGEIALERGAQPASRIDGVEGPSMRIVAGGVAWKALGVVVGQALWYASLLVLAILIPPGGFGVIAVGSVMLSFTTLVLESGTGGSMIIARDLSSASVWRSLVRTSLAGVAATAAFVALAGPIADAFTGGRDVGALRVLGVCIALSAIMIVPNALLMKHLRFRAAALITIGAAAAGSAAAIPVAVLGAGVWALVVRLVVNQAFTAGLTWVAARGLLPPRVRLRGVRVPRRAGANAFLTIASAAFLAWTLDNLVVGAFTNTTQLGLYAFGFSLAYLPLMQVSWTIGQVLLPSIAAARDEAAIRRQTLKAVRMMSLLLLPLLPVALAAAPAVVPSVFGHRWSGMIVPFQILVVVGIGQGVLNALGEALAGAGARSAAIRARIDMIWAVSTIGAIAVGVDLGGIRGAAIAHAVTFCGLAAAYVWRGGLAIGLSLRALLGAIRGVAGCVATQAAVTAALTYGLSLSGASGLLAGLVGSAAGVVAFAAALRTTQPALLAEGRAVLLAALARRRGR